MKRSVWSNGLAAPLIALAALACGANATHGSTDGNTSWLPACEEDAECGDGSECLCGACVRECSFHSDCGSSGACAVVSEANQCDDAPKRNFCGIECESDEDCDSGRCLTGLCIPESSKLRAEVDNVKDQPPSLENPGDWDCSAQDMETLGELQDQFSSGGTPLNAHVGEWTGFVDGSSNIPDEDIFLSLQANGMGTLRIGPAIEFAAPTGADSGYLCNTVDGGDQCDDGLLLAGYEYTLVQVRVNDDRLRFAVQKNEPWEPWCELQSPEPWDVCSFAVGPFEPAGHTSEEWCAVGPNHDELTQIDCGFLAVRKRCACWSEGCRGAPHGVRVDVALFDDGDAMIGSLDDHRVQFRRTD